MIERLSDLVSDIMMPLLPKSDLSHFVGRLVHRPLPGMLGPRSVAWFARRYSINMEEAEYPLSHYQTIGELFTRRLKPGLRPISDTPVVHPADAQITETGTISQLTLVQAKGHTYSVPELLRSAHFSVHFEKGKFITYYLCPTDYHRVHSPVDGEVIWSCHVPGELWPVNAWSVRSVPRLFAINERIIVLIRTPRGLAALVMVAATNVGNMSIAFDANISTRERRGQRHVREHTYKEPIPIKKGDEVGIFHMGSTVVMLYEPGVLEADEGLYRNRHVKMGQSFA